MKKLLLLTLLLLCVGCKESNITKADEDLVKLYCAEGSLKDDKCEIVEVQEASFSCEEKFVFESESKTCIKETTKKAKSVLHCGKNFTLIDNICVSDESYPVQADIAEGSAINDVTSSALCPIDTVYFQGDCKITKKPTSNYKCDKGVLNIDNKTCVLRIEGKVKATCNEEFAYNENTKQCEKVTIVDAIEA